MRHTLIRRLPYSPNQLFALVGDVARYPEFIPWITAMRVYGERPLADGCSQVNAEAKVGFSFLRERFSTQVVRDPTAGVIAVSLLQGPFRHLTNRWSFVAADNQTDVHFDIDFEFKFRLLDHMLHANFDLAVGRLIRCFEDRARSLYGASNVG